MTTPIDDNQEQIIEEIAREFVDASWRGEEPDVDKFVGQYPQFECQLRLRIQDIQDIEALFDSLVQADASDFEEEVDQDLLGKRVGSFEILKVIGRGGMGVVYLANDTKLKRSVAIKGIPAKLSADTKAKVRLRCEAELLASLNHPNIAIIHDIIEDEAKTSYLILEYIEGETLSIRIAREPLTLEQSLSIGRQIAEAISAAHKKGIVHRDLKPGNIKITPDGQVKVLDFGLAKPFTADTGNVEATATHRHHIIGTPAYMSPEQARGQPTDHRTDIWSFGCIMYQMLTGQLPFEGETATDTLAHIIEREPDWKLLPRDIPENVRILLHLCLEKEQDKRLADMTEIILQISDTLSKPLIAPLPAISRRLKKAAMIVGAIVIVILAALGTQFVLNRRAQLLTRNIRLVVLPFDSVNSTGEVWFTEGITNELTTRLGYIHAFDVIANQSAIEFKKMGIANAIDSYKFDYYLEGSVQCERPSDSNSQVKISVRLINAADSTIVWQDTYDRDMSNIFQLQSDIVEEVARALDIKLLEPERKALAYGYTDNTEAYWCFLQGQQDFSRGTREGNEKAIEMYEEAIKFEDEYAQAHASLSNALTQMYWFHDENPELLRRAKKAADRAIELEPSLPGAHVAMGRYYYQGCYKYEYALEEFKTALMSHPNHVWATAWTAYAKRRQGKFDEALYYLERASKLNPVNSSFLDEIALTNMCRRKYEEAEEHCKRAINLAPDNILYHRRLAWTYLQGKRDTDQARKVLKGALEKTGIWDNRTYNMLVLIDIYEGKYLEALDRFDLELKDYDGMAWFVPNELRQAEIYGYMEKEALKQQDYQTAKVNEKLKLEYYLNAVDILEKKKNEDPDDGRYHSALGKAYAGLGLKQDAIDEGIWGVKCLPMDSGILEKYNIPTEGAHIDAILGPYRIEDLARIYVMVGEYHKAIDQLYYLLEKPSSLTVPLLKIDPVWDDLRDHPDYKKLVEQ
ncbi:MAG: protein kinase [Sedimentisphaerales bacterium]|nr:protein kinase [Sedimentisphaerales bacterium]